MKSLKSVLLLLTIVPFALTACDNEINCKDCLETSDSPDLKEGYAYQVSYRDIMESFFLINPPLNPEAEKEEDYTYDISWAQSQNLSWYTLHGGLKGKKIMSLNRISSNILQVNIYRPCEDKEATEGYIKINPKAFNSKTERTKMAVLYAYVYIGKDSALVEKKSENPDESELPESTSESN